MVKHEGRTKFARVKLPQSLPRFVPLPAGSAGDAMTFVFLEDVVCANVQALFPGTTVRGAYVFRIVRDTDMVPSWSAWRQRDDPRALDRRSLPRTLPHLYVRERRQTGDLHRQRKT